MLHRRLLLLNIVAAGVFAFSAYAAASPIDGELARYIGLHGEQIVDDFGDPLLRTPYELWYRNESKITGGHPGVPNPRVTIGRNGVVVTGAGGDYPPLAMSSDLCDVVVKLDRNGFIKTIENHGPGCFEFIHVLKLRQADRSSEPDSTDR